MKKVIDLFAGIGGFSLGLEATGGFKTVAFCEINPFCQKVLSKNFPGVRQYNDITTARFDEPVDLVTAGFPCQDISNAGGGSGLAGERSGLFWHILRTVCMVGQPKLLLENVAALLNRGMGTVLGAMAFIGYDAEWYCVPAAAVGSRQIRERLFIFAAPGQVDNTDSFYQGSIEGFTPKEGWWTTDTPIRPRFGWGTWAREPGMARVAYGVSHGMDRNIALGNAVIPKITEIIGRVMVDIKL